MNEKLEKDLRRFIRENFLFGDRNSDIAGDDSFLELGIIDSTGVMELVDYLEKTFKIELQDEEIVPENLDTIKRLVNFVAEKTQKTQKAK